MGSLTPNGVEALASEVDLDAFAPRPFGLDGSHFREAGGQPAADSVDVGALEDLADERASGRQQALADFRESGGERLLGR